ncbi:hypothetical protein [Pseudomonas fluorescens]|uniref:hypothetical protein n=1 Tax=Pseudomonas fluorescens TaxID=294 RepID=UPI002002AF17|nr:hypothetical protein [Pseudomonas fluorescens]MCK3830166.1 hypothetical protein [Pseudomonas fluorescens]
MSKYADLEMLANKATPEPWWIDSHGMTMMSLPDLQVVFNHPQQSVAVRNEETGNLSHWRNDWDASFIATANPQTILELLAEYKSLRVALDSCAEELAAEVICKHGGQKLEDMHPVTRRLYERDMAPVVEARAVLAKGVTP